MKDFTLLYLGTGAMLLFSLCFIGLVLWATKRLSDQNKFIDRELKYVIQRVDSIESIVRTEFQMILQQLKKI